VEFIIKIGFPETNFYELREQLNEELRYLRKEQLNEEDRKDRFNYPEPFKNFIETRLGKFRDFGTFLG